MVKRVCVGGGVKDSTSVDKAACSTMDVRQGAAKTMTDRLTNKDKWTIFRVRIKSYSLPCWEKKKTQILLIFCVVALELNSESCDRQFKTLTLSYFSLFPSLVCQHLWVHFSIGNPPLFTNSLGSILPCLCLVTFIDKFQVWRITDYCWQRNIRKTALCWQSLN